MDDTLACTDTEKQQMTQHLDLDLGNLPLRWALGAVERIQMSASQPSKVTLSTRF